MLRITGPSGDAIQVDDRPNGARRIFLEPAGGGGAEMTLDAESAREVGLALGAHPLDVGETHNDRTLEKVRVGLSKAIMGLTEQSATDIIAAMQNAGILFRERA